MVKRGKQINSNSIKNEFEGLAGFEEINSYKIIREINSNGNKYYKYEISTGRQPVKKFKSRKDKQISFPNNIWVPSVKQPQQCSDQSWAKKRKDINSDRDSSDIAREKRRKVEVDGDSWRAIFTPEEVIEAIQDLGFNQPTQIQKLTIPAAIKKRRDIIGAAETGSGKTLAFGIPIIDGILKIKQSKANITSRLQQKNLDFESGDSIEKPDSEFGSENEESETENLIEDNDDYDIDREGNNDEKENYDQSSENADEESYETEQLGCVKVIDNADFSFMMDSSKMPKKSPTRNTLYALIITPTRELAIQIKKHLDAVLTKTTLKTAVIIGGMSYEKQERVLSDEPEIVIGTPGRLWELIQQGQEHLSNISDIRYLAIDETDRMVEKGHFEELNQLLELVNGNPVLKKERQTFIFSATLTMTCDPPKRLEGKKKVKKISSDLKIENLIQLIGIRDKPKIVDITRRMGTASLLTEAKINCDKDEKDCYLYYFIKKFPGRTLVFCNSINCVKRLTNLLIILKCEPQALHASKHQKQRLKSLERFATSDQSVLLATDVAARGIDIPGVDHIIHYEVPPTAETYVHRSGRTARANLEGLSVLLIDSAEIVKYQHICRTLNRVSELTSLPIERDVFSIIKERVFLARDIEKAEFGVKKKQNDRSWIQKMASDAGLEMDEQQLDDDDVAEEVAANKKMSKSISLMRAQLNNLISKPVMSSMFNARYPTASGTLNAKPKIAVGGAAASSALSIVNSYKKVKLNIAPKAASLKKHSKRSKKKMKNKKS